MTKAELVEEVARASELNKRDAEVIVETVFGSIINALHRGEKVELRGFGSFRTRERGPRRGRNPKTGAPVDVPAKRVPYFKPGKELKEFFTDGEEPQTASAAAPASESAAAPASESASPAAETAAPVSASVAPASEAAAPASEATEATSEKTTDTAGGDDETTARPA